LRRAGALSRGLVHYQQKDDIVGVRSASDRRVFSAQIFRADVNLSYILKFLQYTPTLVFSSNFRKDLRGA
jgi:hypothetical protein